MSRAFLGLGGNLGNPLQAFQAACNALKAHPQITILNVSPLYQTPPIGGPAGQPDYLNAVIEIDTGLTATQLLSCCQTLETEAGRQRKQRWEARPLDIDLLYFADQVSSDKELTLPHPRLHERHFVLLPLKDLAPQFLHPQLHATTCELLAQLPPAEGISRLTDKWIEL